MKCPVCDCIEYGLAYSGPVRVGSKEYTVQNVLMCKNCSLQRIENFYKPEQYERNEYRSGVGGWDMEAHDEVQRHVFSYMPSVRGKVVVDVGCGSGSLLDMLQGMAAKTIGVEPDEKTPAKPDTMVRSIADVADAVSDITICVDVIEHTEDPVAFAKELNRITKPDGRVIVVTPNLEEVLMVMQPKFKRFWYKVAHNWYFNEDTLWRCMLRAGMVADSMRTIHRYGIHNALGWLRDGNISGQHDEGLQLGEMADDMWRSLMEHFGYGEKIYIECRRREE